MAALERDALDTTLRVEHGSDSMVVLLQDLEFLALVVDLEMVALEMVVDPVEVGVILIQTKAVLELAVRAIVQQQVSQLNIHLEAEAEVERVQQALM